MLLLTGEANWLAKWRCFEPHKIDGRKSLLDLLFCSPFCPFPLIFVINPVFFAVFLKKVAPAFGQYVKSPYLCTRFREATGVESSDAFFCSLPEGRKWIFDRLRTRRRKKTSSACHIIYNICVCACTSNRVIPLETDIQTNNGAGDPVRSDRTIR